MHGSNKKGTTYNLLGRSVDINDTSYRSDYFIVSDLNSTFTSGKNFFTVNGSNKLKPNAAILLEVIDSEGGVLYYETAKDGYFKYSDTTDLIIGVHVYDATPSGFGTLTLLGTTVDGKSVRWSTNIKINPSLDNSSRVVFLNTPDIQVSEFFSYVLNQDISFGRQSVNAISGSVYGYSVFPKPYSDVKSTNFTKFEPDYRIKYINTSSAIGLNLFSKDNINNEIVLHVRDISYLDNNTLKTASVNITESFRVKDVVNNFELKLDRPFTYKINTINQIVPIVSASFSHQFFSNLYITSSGLTGSGDGTPEKNVYFYQTVDGEDIFLRESFLDITYKNLKTLTGKVHRHKVYRRSLNKAADFECIADEPLTEKEFIFDSATINRFYANIGEFYNMNHVNRYYYTSSSDLTLSQSSSEVLNSLTCNVTNLNLDQSIYIIIKNDTSLLTANTYSSSYINYDEQSFLTQTGSSYDSNFIKLYKNSDYLFTANVDIQKNDVNKESKLLFYFTGSYNTGSATVEKNYTFDKGLILHQYVLPIGTNFKKFTKKDFNVLNFLNDYIGTITIVPVNISQFRLDNLSLISHAERGFSPDSFYTRIPFPVSIKNEQFEIKSELLDVNNNSVYSGLKKIISADKDGLTLYKNISGFVQADAQSIINVVASGSGKLILSASRDPSQTFSSDRAALSVIESFVVISDNPNGDPFFKVESGSRDPAKYMELSGSFYLTGSQFIRDGFYLYGTSSNAVSSSYSLSSSYAVSSSYAKTSSLGYYISDNSQNSYFTASSFGESARTASGYIKTNISGIGEIYIPYYNTI